VAAHPGLVDVPGTAVALRLTGAGGGHAEEDDRPGGGGDGD
jgi:hypothetical protein